MRVTPAALPPVPRDHGKPAAAEQPRFKLNATPTDAGTAPEKAAAPAAVAGRQLPPGLDRVMARLEAMPPESRNAGQSNALDRIGRNIARYQEHHGMATPAPTVPENPPAETPVVAAPVETEPTPPAAPVETVAETPVATTPEAPVAAPVDAPAEIVAAPVDAVDPLLSELVDTLAEAPVAAPVDDPLAVVADAPAAGEAPLPGSTIDVQA